MEYALLVLTGINLAGLVLVFLFIKKQLLLLRRDIPRDVKEVQALLSQTLDKMGEMEKQFEEVKFLEKKLFDFLPGCIQKMATVRFNALSDVGGEQSFALALLDGKDNGVILSSLYGRGEFRLYAKPITEGKSKFTLSGEEQQALDTAKRGLLAAS